MGCAGWVGTGWGGVRWMGWVLAEYREDKVRQNVLAFCALTTARILREDG